ncbi:unnamed protein product, partial [Linum tenue]
PISLNPSRIFFLSSLFSSRSIFPFLFLAASSFLLPFYPLGLSSFLLPGYERNDQKSNYPGRDWAYMCVFFGGGGGCSKWDSDVFLYGFWFRTRAEEKGVTWWPRVLTAVKGSSARQVRRGRSG